MSDTRERAFPAAARQAPAAMGIATQAAFYTTGADNLRLVSVCSIPGVTIVLSGRTMSADGTIGRFKHTHQPNNNRTSKVTDHPLAAGYVLNVTAVAVGADVPIGGCFVIVQIIGGLGGATEVLGTLIQGYVTTLQHRAWPGSMIESSIDGPGRLRTFTGTIPAASAEVTEIVPTGARWELLGMTLVLQPMTIGTSRRTMLYAESSGLSLFYAISAHTVDAPNELNQNFSSGLGETPPQMGAFGSNPLPVSIPLPPGAGIRTLTSGMMAGDQYTYVQVTVREWLEAA